MAVGCLTGEAWIFDNVYPLTDQNWNEIDDLEVMSTLLFDYEQV